jgi:hypothetical protein
MVQRLFALRGRSAGFSLLELAVVGGLVSVFMTAVCFSVFALQRSFEEEQTMSSLVVRGQHAMERLATVANQAITRDADFEIFYAHTTDAYAVMRFRLIDSLVGGVAVYDDQAKVYICGDKGDPEPCQGLIIGRGPDLATIASLGSGPDGILGTVDDDVRASYTAGIPAVELLLPSTFAPRSGTMLTITPDLGNGLLVKFTLRMNARSRDGSYILDNDLVLTQNVALRQ